MVHSVEGNKKGNTSIQLDNALITTTKKKGITIWPFIVYACHGNFLREWVKARIFWGNAIQEVDGSGSQKQQTEFLLPVMEETETSQTWMHVINIQALKEITVTNKKVLSRLYLVAISTKVWQPCHSTPANGVRLVLLESTYVGVKLLMPFLQPSSCHYYFAASPAQ